jgi:hypothetical protein
MLVKPLSVAEDIQSAASVDATINANPLVLCVNGSSTAAAEVTVVATGFIAYVPPGGSIVIEKPAGSALDATGASASVWATAVAYKN